ncbi:hypothetical protein LCGC14_0434150 [marine sediment metagenome]|uniref:Uncharacterized protein n=1 Tax=marine sediment metagenome TaxID=412755 RepID=A0A0F9SM63_9ZZZZ
MNSEEMELLLSLKLRWRRWLGQMTRNDKPNWTKLLNNEWFGWPSNVLGDDYANPLLWGREKVKAYYSKAIDKSTIRDFLKLDNIYCAEVLVKKATDEQGI